MAQSEKAQPGDALHMQVECECSRYPVGIPQDIRLRIRVNDKTRDADFEILLPAGIAFRPEDVYVGIDGREPVLLTGLQEPKVGRGSIRHNLNDSHILFVWDVTLPGESGGEVDLLIRDACFRWLGNYNVKILVDMLQGGTHKVFQQTLVLSCKAAQ